MSRLIRLSYSGASGDYQLFIDNHLSARETTLVAAYVGMNRYKTLLGVSDEAYREYLNVRDTLSPNGIETIFSPDQARRYKNAFNDAMKTADPIRVAELAMSPVRVIYCASSESSTGTLHAMLMPQVYCEGCDTEEHCLYYWLPYNCYRKQELLRHFIDCNETLINCSQPEVSTCPSCQPQSYQMITGLWPYGRYSLNSTRRCSCAGCRN